MAKPRTEWQPLPHDPILRLAENLWWVKAPVPGIALNRTMTIARLQDGRLVIYNGVALDEGSMREIEAWGTPAFLIVPGAGHRLDAPAFKRRYPGLRVLAPGGARKAVEGALAVDGLLQDFPSDGEVSFRAIPGIRDKEGAMLVRSADGTSVVVNDVIFNMHLPQALVPRLLIQALGSAPGVRVSRIVKLLYCDDKPAFAAGLRELAHLPDLTRLIVGHDSVASGAAARAALLAAAEQVS